MRSTALRPGRPIYSDWPACKRPALRSRLVNAQIKEIDRQIPELLTDLGCTLTDLVGIGVVTAMTLLAEVGDPARFRTRSTVRSLVRSSPGRGVIR